MCDNDDDDDDGDDNEEDLAQRLAKYNGEGNVEVEVFTVNYM